MGGEGRRKFSHTKRHFSISSSLEIPKMHVDESGVERLEFLCGHFERCDQLGGDGAFIL